MSNSTYNWIDQRNEQIFEDDFEADRQVFKSIYLDRIEEEILDPMKNLDSYTQAVIDIAEDKELVVSR